MTGLTSVSEGAALAHPRPEILALTGLRGVAAVGVVASQIGVWPSAPQLLHQVVAASSLAVPFFFLLSGFVLGYNYPALSLSPRPLARYAMARVARLLPLFLVVAMCVLVLGGRNGSDWVRAVLGDQAWLVGTAAALYAVYPLLARLIAANPWRAAAAAFGVDLIVLAARLILSSDSWLYRNPLVWIPELVIGAALACLVTRGFRLPAAYLIQGSVLVYAVAVVALAGGSSASQYGAVWSLPLGLLVLSVVGPSRISSILASRFVVRLGVIGFATYLVQGIVVDAYGPVHGRSPADVLFVLGWIGLTLLIAEGAHRYVGAPGRRYLMSLARNLDRRTAAVRD